MSLQNEPLVTIARSKMSFEAWLARGALEHVRSTCCLGRSSSYLHSCCFRCS